LIADIPFSSVFVEIFAYRSDHLEPHFHWTSDVDVIVPTNSLASSLWREEDDLRYRLARFGFIVVFQMAFLSGIAVDRGRYHHPRPRMSQGITHPVPMRAASSVRSFTMCPATDVRARSTVGKGKKARKISRRFRHGEEENGMRDGSMIRKDVKQQPYRRYGENARDVHFSETDVIAHGYNTTKRGCDCLPVDITDMRRPNIHPLSSGTGAPFSTLSTARCLLITRPDEAYSALGLSRGVMAMRAGT
jgi:hypothetical protein